MVIFMPRGKKKKAYVVRSAEGNNILGHMYVNSYRDNLEKIKPRKKYDPKLRKHVEIKLKEEKHS